MNNPVSRWMVRISIGNQHQTPTFLDAANILHDDISGIVWYPVKIPEICTNQIFVTGVMHIVYSHILAFFDNLYKTFQCFLVNGFTKNKYSETCL